MNPIPAIANTGMALTFSHRGRTGCTEIATHAAPPMTAAIAVGHGWATGVLPREVAKRITGSQMRLLARRTGPDMMVTARVWPSPAHRVDPRPGGPGGRR